MAKINVRRPTEEAALARVFADEKKHPRGDPMLLQKTVMDEVGVKYLVCCFHTTVNMSISYLWYQWQKDYKEMTFVNFLQYYGIIYAYRKVS